MNLYVCIYTCIQHQKGQAECPDTDTNQQTSGKK